MPRLILIAKNVLSHSAPVQLKFPLQVHDDELRLVSLDIRLKRLRVREALDELHLFRRHRSCGQLKFLS